VLNTASTAKSVASKLGKGYDVGSLRLRDTLELLVHGDKNACYNAGHDTDPYLAGVVNFFVHMNVVGSDVVNIQDSKWTGPAGNLVDACLNKAAQNWKFDATFGKAAAYIIQVKFEAVIPKPRTLAEDSAAKKDSAAKAAAAKKKPKN